MSNDGENFSTERGSMAGTVAVLLSFALTCGMIWLGVDGEKAAEDDQ